MAALKLLYWLAQNTALVLQDCRIPLPSLRTAESSTVRQEQDDETYSAAYTHALKTCSWFFCCMLMRLVSIPVRKCSMLQNCPSQPLLRHRSRASRKSITSYSGGRLTSFAALYRQVKCPATPGQQDSFDLLQIRLPLYCLSLSCGKC